MEAFRNEEIVLNVLADTVRDGGRIAVYGDYDVDGLMSLIGCRDALAMAGAENVFPYHYYSRTHEIDANFLNFCLSRRAQTAVICDTGSDNMELLKRFCAYGIKCIILDHHTTAYRYEDFPDGCFVINTAIDRLRYGIDNEMCGGGITFMVCSKLLDRLGAEYDAGYLAVYALVAQYADAVPMDTEFGRYVYELARRRVSTPKYVDYFMESYSELTKRFVEYTYAPKINAVFRREEFGLINSLFLEDSPDAFLLINQIKELHVSTIEIVENLVKVLQTENLGGIVVANLTPLLNADLPNNFIMNHKGRIANAVANTEGCPCICVCDSGQGISGSLRDLEGRDFLKYFAPLFKAGGHPSAFGFSLSYADWPSFADTVRAVGKMAEGEGDTRAANPEYDMTRWFDLDMLRQIAYENEFVSARKPPAYVRVTLKRIVEATKFGLAYLLHSDGAESLWLASDKKIPYPQEVLVYPYMQKKLKVKAVWR